MNKKTLHEYLVEELRTRVPNSSELMNSLGDILYLGKEAIYRRMRGEVQFSLEEASTISEKMGISMDGFSGVSELKRPFIFKITNFDDPQEMDYKMIGEIVDFLENIKNIPKTEIVTAAKMIPDAIHLFHPHITRFYLFKWMYQYDNPDSMKKYEEVRSTDKLLGILNNMRDLFQYIKKSCYIFDKKIFENLSDDIKYFHTIGLIDHNSIQLIKEDILACIDDIEILAARGVNSVGNRTEIYLSNLNFEAGFAYIKSGNYKLSTIRAFTLYDISSNDIVTFEKSLQWMQSLKRASMLISESSEIERMNFLNRQREIIKNL